MTALRCYCGGTRKELAGVGAFDLHADGQTRDVHKLMLGSIGAVHESWTSCDGSSHMAAQIAGLGQEQPQVEFVECVGLFIAATLLFGATGAVRGRSGDVFVESLGEAAARFEVAAVTLPGTRKGRCV
jgi:hypothetical protein